MNGAQILIVEDEAIVSMDIQARLKRLGYGIAGVADSAEQAVQMAEVLRPDLVLMDIRLKGEMDGVGAADEIRSCFDLPVVFLTAYADDATLERAKVTQPYGYLLKPFKDQELHTIIEVALYRHRSDKILRETQERLAQSEKMAALGRLIGAVAHEINNPLQAVQGCLALSLEMLESFAADVPGQSDRPWEKVRQYLRIAEAETERIAAIVRRVRESFRPLYSDRQDIDLHFLLEAVLEQCREELRANDIVVETNWVAELPKVHGDPGLLERVFLNIVRNAVEAMPNGGTLRLSSAIDKMGTTDSRNAAGVVLLTDVVRIDLKDSGVGMLTEVQAHLFEPFFTTKERGPGLGLSISYGIIQAHNGQILMESQEGVGSTFSILLPVSE